MSALGVEAPIFIGGLAYSGKTPLRRALGMHPDLSMTRKTHLWDRFNGRFGDLSSDANLERCLAAMQADPGVAALGLDLDRVRAEIRSGPATYPRLFAAVHRHHAERVGARRWGEQLGSVERYASQIFAALPEARMIHMIRDPRERFEASVHRRPGAVGWQTAMWRRSAELAERNLARYPGSYLVVRYESLAAQPCAVLEHVCRFVSLACLPPMRAVIEEAFEVPSVGQPATSARAFVDRYAGPFLPAFGYERQPPAHEPISAILGRPVNRVAMAAWRLADARSRREGG